ncbi:MAG: carboxypeptidase regulatory-like domain-containing protein [Candidatus Hydrogenedentes bacterium]|nr:carboxypeptidase regulatory-like domain-containing protein [Candidatus Hydrogenedentota bacterium]
MGQEGMGRALSNQDGTFSIVAIFTEPGYELVLMASSERGKSGIMEPIIVPEGGVHGVVLRLTEKLSGSIAGRVVNTNGEPVFAMINARPAGERLRMTMEEALARRNSEERWQASIGHAQTNIDGEFVVMSLREGEYNLFVGEYDPSGFQSTDQKAGTVMLQSGQHLTGVDLVLDAGRGDITGVVTDEQGRPVSGVYVLAQAVGKDEDREIAAMTDASGKFRVKNLQEELYIVRANLQGYTCNPVRDVAPGESLTFVMVARKEQ